MAVAREILGEPNKQLSGNDEKRFGTHGSTSLDVKTGRFYDHERKEGGGVLWFIEQHTGQSVEGGRAVEWLRDHGYHIEDDRGPPPGDAGGSKAKQQSRNDRNGNWLPPAVPDHGEQTAVYDYREPDGTLRYQVVRFDWSDPESPKGRGKTFLQRKPDNSNRSGFTWKTKGVEPLPYRLPELLEDIAEGSEIFFVEGEKKVDMLRALGVPATCNSGGAGKFPDELLGWFRGARVTILPDKDPQAKTKDGKLLFHPDGRPVHAGQDHADLVGGKLISVADRVRLLKLPNLPEKGGVDDWLPAGGSAEELYSLAVLAPLFEAVPFSSKFGAVEWLDFDAPGPVYEQLIKGVLTKGELSLLLGESQSGKSFLAIDIAMAVARGIPWMGRKVRQGLIIYQAGESAVGVRRKRFPAYRRHYQVGAERLPVVLLQSPLDLYSGDDPTDAFIEECIHWARSYGTPLELITIDTFNKATPGANENDGKDMGIVLARCDRIRKATGAHVQLVHHLNAGGQKARGHTSLFANVENVIMCRIVPDHTDADGRKVREAVIAKQKDGEDGISFKFVLPQVEIGVDADGEKVTSCIVAEPSGQAGAAIPNPTATQLGGMHAKVYRALYDVLDDPSKYEHAPRELGLPDGARVVNNKHLSARFAETEKPDGFDELSEEDKDKERGRIRQALKRSRDHLYQKGIIGISDDLLYVTGKPIMGFGQPPGTQRRKSRSDAMVENPPADLPFNDDELDRF